MMYESWNKFDWIELNWCLCKCQHFLLQSFYRYVLINPQSVWLLQLPPNSCVPSWYRYILCTQLISLYPRLIPASSNFVRSIPPLHEIADINQLARGDKVKVQEFKDFLLRYLEVVRGTPRGMVHALVGVVTIARIGLYLYISCYPDMVLFGCLPQTTVCCSVITTVCIQDYATGSTISAKKLQLYWHIMNLHQNNPKFTTAEGSVVFQTICLKLSIDS